MSLRSRHAISTATAPFYIAGFFFEESFWLLSRKQIVGRQEWNKGA